MKKIAIEEAFATESLIDAWRAMIADGAPGMFTGQWWPAVFPGITLAVTVMGYALLTNAITDLSDPRKHHG